MGTCSSVLHITTEMLVFLSRLMESDDSRFTNSMSDILNEIKRYDKKSQKKIYELLTCYFKKNRIPESPTNSQIENIDNLERPKLTRQIVAAHCRDMEDEKKDN